VIYTGQSLRKELGCINFDVWRLEIQYGNKDTAPANSVSIERKIKTLMTGMVALACSRQQYYLRENVTENCQLL